MYLWLTDRRRKLLRTGQFRAICAALERGNSEAVGSYGLSQGHILCLSARGCSFGFYKRECQEQTPPQSCRRVLLGSAFSPSFARCVRASCDGCLRDPIWVCRQLGFRFRGHANFLPRASSEAVSIPRTSLSLPIAWVFAGYAKCRVLKRHSAETVT